MINALSYLLQAYLIIGFLILTFTIFTSKEEFDSLWGKLSEEEGKFESNVIIMFALVHLVLTLDL
mgnify:CR=1 FL=1